MTHRSRSILFCGQERKRRRSGATWRFLGEAIGQKRSRDRSVTVLKPYHSQTRKPDTLLYWHTHCAPCGQTTGRARYCAPGCPSNLLALPWACARGLPERCIRGKQKCMDEPIRPRWFIIRKPHGGELPSAHRFDPGENQSRRSLGWETVRRCWGGYGIRFKRSTSATRSS